MQPQILVHCPTPGGEAKRLMHVRDRYPDPTQFWLYAAIKFKIRILLWLGSLLKQVQIY